MTTATSNRENTGAKISHSEQNFKGINTHTPKTYLRLFVYLILTRNPTIGSQVVS